MIGNLLKAGVICFALGSGSLSNPSVIIQQARFNENVEVAYLNFDHLIDTPSSGNKLFYYDYSMVLHEEDLVDTPVGASPFDLLSSVSSYEDVFFGMIRCNSLMPPLPLQNANCYLPFVANTTFTFNNVDYVCDGFEVSVISSKYSIQDAFGFDLTGFIDTDSNRDYIGISLGAISTSNTLSSSYLVSQYAFDLLRENTASFEVCVLCNYTSSIGYATGYQNGVNDGYNQGYQQGVGTAQQGTFLNLFNSIADTPLRFIYGLFSFDLFGTSMLVIILSLLTGIVLFGVVKKFWK